MLEQERQRAEGGYYQPSKPEKPTLGLSEGSVTKALNAADDL